MYYAWNLTLSDEFEINSFGTGPKWQTQRDLFQVQSCRILPASDFRTLDTDFERKFSTKIAFFTIFKQNNPISVWNFRLKSYFSKFSDKIADFRIQIFNQNGTFLQFSNKITIFWLLLSCWCIFKWNLPNLMHSYLISTYFLVPGHGSTKTSSLTLKRHVPTFRHLN